MVKTIVNGAAGRMGSKDNSAYSGDRRYQPVRRNRRQGHQSVGKDAGEYAMWGGWYTHYRQPFKDN